MQRFFRLPFRFKPAAPWFLASLVLASLGPLPFASEPVAVEAKLHRVAIFKNGFALVTVRADLPDAKGSYRLAAPEDPRLGSFWIATSEGVALNQVVSRLAETEQERPARSISELLRANEGRDVEVQLEDGWITGRLTLPKSDDLAAASPNAIQPRMPVPPPPTPRPAGLAVVDHGKSSTVLPIDAIKRVRGAAVGTKFIAQEKVPVVEIEVSGRSRKPQLEMSWLANGLAWSPSYVIDLTGEDQARMTAKAIIVNDLMDFSGTQAELVTGFPHLQYANSPSFITPQQALNSLIGSMNSGGARRNNFSNVAMAQSARFESDMMAPSAPAAPLAGQSVGDLWFTEIDDLTLKKGDRSYKTLFTADISAEHLYTWDVARDGGNRYGLRNLSNEQVVWHALELKNDTDRPWTTAAAMTREKGRLLGQDTLHYTPAGASSKVVVNRALDIRTDFVENEVTRERGVRTQGGRRYDRVQISGKLRLVNLKAKP